jgi:hypothetical protein
LNIEYYYLFLEWVGDIKSEKSEVKNLKWVEPKEIRILKLEEAYKYWFNKLNYL